MGKFHTDQSVPSQARIILRDIWKTVHVNPQKTKKNTNSRWRNFSTLQTLQNWCILGNQTIKIIQLLDTNLFY